MRVEDDRRKDDVRRTRSGMKRSAMPERRKADHQPQMEAGPGTSVVPGTFVNGSELEDDLADDVSGLYLREPGLGLVAQGQDAVDHRAHGGVVAEAE